MQAMSKRYINRIIPILAASVPISAPTLIIHGEEDNLIELDSVRHFEENIPDVKVKIYPNIGHLPMYEDPARTAIDIKNFLQKTKSD